jgi:ABC-type proline/glycine betaine transport system ATPase subunit
VLLLDDPFSALDALTRTDLQDHLLDLWADSKPTLVLVTRDVEDATVRLIGSWSCDHGRAAYSMRSAQTCHAPANAAAGPSMWSRAAFFRRSIGPLETRGC